MRTKLLELIDTPEFPDFVKPTAKGQGRNLQELQETSDYYMDIYQPLCRI